LEAELSAVFIGDIITSVTGAVEIIEHSVVVEATNIVGFLAFWHIITPLSVNTFNSVH
jgi:hypothetical protein